MDYFFFYRRSYKQHGFGYRAFHFDYEVNTGQKWWDPIICWFCFTLKRSNVGQFNKLNLQVYNFNGSPDLLNSIRLWQRLFVDLFQDRKWNFGRDSIFFFLNLQVVWILVYGKRPFSMMCCVLTFHQMVAKVHQMVAKDFLSSLLLLEEMEESEPELWGRFNKI